MLLLLCQQHFRASGSLEINYFKLVIDANLIKGFCDVEFENQHLEARV